MGFSSRFSGCFQKLRLPGFRLPKVRSPVLTAGEKTALAALVLVLGTGAGLRAWERSGMRLGPVDDWESLRALLIRAREDHEKEGGGGFACDDDASAGSYGTTAEAGATREILAAGTAPATKGAKKVAGSGKKTAPARPVDLNTAGEKALQSLPGVGPSTARAILGHRAARGPFRSVDDLLQVKGIGPKKLEVLRPYLKVEPKGASRNDTPTGTDPGGIGGAAPEHGDSAESRSREITPPNAP